MSLVRMAAVSSALVLAGTAVSAQESEYSWQPDKPINIIVPWAAGGSTDQVTRVVAPILEEALGVEVVVVNQPGASGSIGTQAALDAPRDGYTWTANAIANNATYAITGLLEDTSIEDYHIYLHVANVPVVSVNADSDIESFDQMLEQMRSDEVTVGTAGVNSSGGMALASIKDGMQEELPGARMITYDGGNPAVIAAASGEVDATTQLAVEQAEMIRAGRLRPLVVLSDSALELGEGDPIPPITDSVPDFHVAQDFFGVFIPTGAPQEVYDTVDQVWEDHVMNSEALKTYANENGAVFAPSYGEDALAAAMPVVEAEACARVTRGEAVVDPSEFGIDCPES
ncbi:Bug family tripartite tricarboxylate transporter substrate binding protein [Paracoccus sediminicola]|uniref:Bug family tripartite tricarboxylate transporter substrate binding protein n=1 Tax=Paracoccus sediminicola TaxID=3017783 RepID=UPI0022F0485A|nr:tripartite tricarboxylate transporter substrate binding protein [Paracoccus sediminicola]WBU58078.1 tripartite tricarboxylate transporter substrate binding protein [Paracoccus sediminicola]